MYESLSPRNGSVKTKLLKQPSWFPVRNKWIRDLEIEALSSFLKLYTFIKNWAHGPSLNFQTNFEIIYSFILPFFFYWKYIFSYAIYFDYIFLSSTSLSSSPLAFSFLLENKKILRDKNKTEQNKISWSKNFYQIWTWKLSSTRWVPRAVIRVRD